MSCRSGIPSPGRTSTEAMYGVALDPWISHVTTPGSMMMSSTEPSLAYCLPRRSLEGSLISAASTFIMVAGSRPGWFAPKGLRGRLMALFSVMARTPS